MAPTMLAFWYVPGLQYEIEEQETPVWGLSVGVPHSARHGFAFGGLLSSLLLEQKLEEKQTRSGKWSSGNFALF